MTLEQARNQVMCDKSKCKHCNNGSFDGKYGADVECVNGVLIDIDVFNENYQEDVIYPVAPCHPDWEKQQNDEDFESDCQERLAAASPQEMTLEQALARIAELEKLLSKKQSYVVAKGDTLGTIAKKFYGDEKKWRPIHNENLFIIGPDPFHLVEDTTLIIPKVKL